MTFKLFGDSKSIQKVQRRNGSQTKAVTCLQSLACHLRATAVQTDDENDHSKSKQIKAAAAIVSDEIIALHSLRKASRKKKTANTMRH